jgi:hypothetical protein
MDSVVVPHNPPCRVQIVYSEKQNLTKNSGTGRLIAWRGYKLSVPPPIVAGVLGQFPDIGYVTICAQTGVHLAKSEVLVKCRGSDTSLLPRNWTALAAPEHDPRMAFLRRLWCLVQSRQKHMAG